MSKAQELDFKLEFRCGANVVVGDGWCYPANYAESEMWSKLQRLESENAALKAEVELWKDEWTIQAAHNAVLEADKAELLEALRRTNIVAMMRDVDALIAKHGGKA